MTPRIDEALADPLLFGASLNSINSWRSWIAILRAASGIELDAAESEFFASVSGGRTAPTAHVRELIAIIGRRSGKSRIAALIAVFEACLRQHKLAAGEVGTVLVLAATMSQAAVVFNYALGYLDASPLLRQQIVSSTATEIRLAGNVTIAVHPANFKSVRGRTILAAIFDEMAFWRDDESANPDREVLRAVLPSLAASGGPLVCISSPYRKVGVLYERHKNYFGVDDERVLVVQGASRLFNPTLDQSTIAQAHADDAESAASEWDGAFRQDLSSYLDDDLINAAIDVARPREIAPVQGRKYVAFVDPSGGRSDAYCLCIGHRDGERFVADVVRGVSAPLDPQFVTKQLASLVREYHCTKVVGDNYSGEWVSQAWRDEGLTYERSDQPASALYLEALPSFARNAISIPDHAPLIRELRQLERRTTRMGRDQVTHPQGGHDDYANALCGALRLAVKPLNLMQSGALEGGLGTLGPGWRPKSFGTWGNPPPPYSPPPPRAVPRLMPLGSDHPDDPFLRRS